MNMPLKTKLFASLLAGAVVLNASSPAISKSGIELGLLSCTVEGGFGLLIGSSRDMVCVFDPAGSELKKGKYIGQINKLGLDIGVTNKSYIKWAVVAAEEYVHAPGQLTGTYSGASASASVAVGLGANVLVGGSKNAVALQPLSVQGQSGLNLAIGVSQLKLAYLE